jgi:ADP-heptose:LPS heptosyltransferase
MEDNEYEYFVEKTGIQIPAIYKPSSFEELCIIINSCKLFVGATSMPLCLAHSTHVPRIVGLPDNNDIKGMASGLIHYLPNIVSEI